MIYGVMVRDAEGGGTDFTIVDTEWMLNYQYDGFARLGTW